MGRRLTFNLTLTQFGQEIRRRIEEAQQNPDYRPVLVVALDGAHAITRPRATLYWTLTLIAFSHTLYWTLTLIAFSRMP